MKKISATILTFNEEGRIEQCLRSLTGVADEIVVVDSFSTDRTVEICKSFGCRVCQRKLVGFGAQRQYATSLTLYPYVLSVDADESLSPALVREIIELKENGFEHRVYTVPRLNFFCGRPVRHCGWYPDRQLRLFDKRYANWSLSEVEETVEFRHSVSPYPLNGDLIHSRAATIADFRQKERQHASLQAVRLAQGEPIGLFAPLWAAASGFADCYLRRGGISNGFAGYAISREQCVCAYKAFNEARLLQNKKSDKTKQL